MGNVAFKLSSVRLLFRKSETDDAALIYFQKALFLQKLFLHLTVLLAKKKNGRA